MNNKSLNNGFTLVELMIVIMIIGILSAIAVPSYRNYTEKANLADASTTLTNASQKISERKLQLFNGNFIQSDLDTIIKEQISNGNNVSKKYSIGVKCLSDTDCSTYHLYAEPKSSSNLRKSVWLGNNGSLYICNLSSVNSITDASTNSDCTKQ